jgi:hypothetical protein
MANLKWLFLHCGQNSCLYVSRLLNFMIGVRRGKGFPREIRNCTEVAQKQELDRRLRRRSGGRSEGKGERIIIARNKRIDINIGRQNGKDGSNFHLSVRALPYKIRLEFE